MLSSEDLFNTPQKILARTMDFLSVSKFELSSFDIHNALPYQEIQQSTQRLLMDYFEPYNQKLYQYLGMNFGWENQKPLNYYR